MDFTGAYTESNSAVKNAIANSKIYTILRNARFKSTNIIIREIYFKNLRLRGVIKPRDR